MNSITIQLINKEIKGKFGINPTLYGLIFVGITFNIELFFLSDRTVKGVRSHSKCLRYQPREN